MNDTGPGGGGTPRPRDDRRRGALPSPWGVTGTLIGLVATFSLWLLVGGLFQPFLSGTEFVEEPVAIRYGLFFAMQAAFLAVPLAALALTGSRPGAIGLRGTTVRAIVEALACAALLSGLTWLFRLAMLRFLPDAGARFLAEEAEQMRALAGPAALLWIAAICIVPVLEEIFFRGFVFVGLRGRFDFALASGLSAALFAVSHGMPYSMPPLFAVGLGTAVLYERHGSVVPCIAAHAGFNLLSLIATALG